MDVVCELCGAVGYKHLLVQCNSCRNATRHRYCLDTIIYDPSIEWLCDDCAPRHNEATESLNWRFDDHHSIQLGSFIIDEPNVNRVEVMEDLCSWGHCRHRSHMARRYSTWGHRKHRSRKARMDSTDACTRHFPSEGTLNSSEMFIGENSKFKDVEKEGEIKNDHLTYGPETADGSICSASDLAAEIQKTMDDVEPTMNTDCLDLGLLKEKDSCSLSPSYVEGSICQGSKTDFLPLIIERSQPFVIDDFCPPLPTVLPEDGSSQASESAEQFCPWVVVNPNGSSHSPLKPALEIEQETEAGLFASVYDVQQSHPSFTDETSPTLSCEEHIDGSMSESWEQPQPLEVVKPWEDVPKSILGSNNQSNYSQPMQSSGLDVGNTNLLDSSKACLFSRSMSKTVEPSSPSNGDGDSAVEQDHAEGTATVTPTVDNVQGSSPSAEPSNSSNGGDSAVEKNSAERTECLSGMEIITPTLDNVQGSSPSAEPSSSSKEERDSAVEKNSAERTECLSHTETGTPALDSVQGSSTSIAKECLVSDVDNSDEANRSDKRILCSIENKESGQVEVPSHLNILNGELHWSHNGLDESSHLNSELKGRNTQDDVPKASVSAGKNVVCSQVSQMEDDNSEALPSKNASPCKATKSNFKKRSKRHTQCHTEHQETKLEIITKDRNADPVQLKSCRPSKHLDHACSSVASELSSKTKEVNNANDAEPIFSSAAQSFENIVPMKSKRLILPCDEDKDAKAMQVGDSNPPSSKNDGQVRMNRRHVEYGAMNKRRSGGNHEQVSCPGNTQTKKQRRENKDKNTPLRNPSVRCAPNDAEQLASETAVAEGHCSLSRMPVFSAPTDQERFICQPVDRPYWTGIMRIGQEYISLAAHLSNQACKKVQELSRSLPPVMKVTKHSKLKAWPKRWDASSEPTAESIGLYFFSDNMRPNKDLDRLVQYVTDHSIILKYVFGFDKLLIFPSVLLPERCQTFQGKPYMWGVFRSRSCKSKAATQVKQKVSTSHAAERKDHEDKVQGDTQVQEMPVSKGTTPSERQPSPGAVHGIGTEIDPSDHRKPHENSEGPLTKLLGLVVAQTPRSEQFIKELENEGALVFSVKGLVKPGPLGL